MHDGIAAAIIITVMFGGIISVIKTFQDYFLRRKLINMGQVDQTSLNILGEEKDSRFTALKWGLIILFGGLGLVLLEFIPYRHDSPFPYGVEAVFIAIGFLIYYFVVKKELGKN